MTFDYGINMNRNCWLPIPAKRQGSGGRCKSWTAVFAVYYRISGVWQCVNSLSESSVGVILVVADFTFPYKNVTSVMFCMLSL